MYFIMYNGLTPWSPSCRVRSIDVTQRQINWPRNTEIKGFQTFGNNNRLLETLFFYLSIVPPAKKNFVGLRLENCFLPCELRELLSN